MNKQEKEAATGEVTKLHIGPTPDATESVCFGVHPMLFTAFDKQGRQNRVATERMVDAAIFAGAHGIAILGELSEFSRQSPAEQRRLMEWVAEHIQGRVRLCVSISAPDVGGQVEMLRAARDVGATWAMLQPPPLPGLADSELLRILQPRRRQGGDPDQRPQCSEGARAGPDRGGVEAPEAEQSQLVAVKLEADSVSIAETVDELEGELDVINGRGALEMTDCLRAGAIGIMPGIESIDVTSSMPMRSSARS